MISISTVSSISVILVLLIQLIVIRNYVRTDKKEIKKKIIDETVKETNINNALHEIKIGIKEISFEVRESKKDTKEIKKDLNKMNLDIHDVRAMAERANDRIDTMQGIPKRKKD